MTSLALIVIIALAGSGVIRGLAIGGDQAPGCGGPGGKEDVRSTTQRLVNLPPSFVDADADTYVQRDNSGPHGSETHIYVKNAGSAITTRKGLIRFSVPNGAVGITSLSLDVSMANHTTVGASTTSTINVWGIKDGATASCGESFSPTVRYNDLTFLDDSADGTVDGSPCLHDGEPAQAGVQPLGTFTISAADLNRTVIFSSPALADFMGQSTNGVVTLALTRVESDGQLNTAFAASEHATLKAPRLTWVAPERYTAVADTYVMGNNSGGHGSEGGIVVTRYQSSDYRRNGFVRFYVPTAGTFADANLSLTLGTYTANGVNSASFYLWGIKDGTIGCTESFPESTLVYSGVPFVDTTPDGIDSSSPCLTSPSYLATVTVSGADVGKTVTFSSPELTHFVSANANTHVAFALTTNTLGPYAAFLSREQSTGQPTLTVMRADDIVFDNGSPVIPQGGGTVHYEGSLHLPFAGGGMIGIPGAKVDMTYNAQGHLSTLSGTVGYPELPGVGTWGSLGPITGTAPYLQIGYNYPSAFNTFGLPLDSKSKFFYLSADTTTSASWGPVSVTAPGPAVGFMMAIDPATPSVFIHGDQSGTPIPISTSTDLGFSWGQNIPFTPKTTWGVTSKMVGFGGDLYVGGSLSPSLPDVNESANPVSLTLTGAVIARFNQDNFALKEPGKWLQNFGSNAKVTLGFGLGAFSAFDIKLASASVLYQRAVPSLAFSGVVDPNVDLLQGVPFLPKASFKVAGYLSKSANSSFLDFEGDYKFGTSFVKQTINGHVHITSAGASFAGTAKFAGTTISVDGAIYSSYATFSGEIDHNWDLGVGRLKTTIEASFDSRNLKVGLSAKARVCIAGNCDSVSVPELDVDDSGHIRICANVAGSQKCDTLP